MKRLVLKPGEVAEIESTGMRRQIMLVEVMDDGIITYRTKPRR